MPETTATETPIWGYELKDFIQLPGEADATEVTNLLSWELDDDEETYEPDYINTKKKPKFVVGSSASIEFEMDAYKGNKLSEFMIAHEGEKNIHVNVIRQHGWREDGYAKAAPYLLNVSALDKNSAGEPVKLKGSLNMDAEEWTEGTFLNGLFAEGFGTEEPPTTDPDPDNPENPDQGEEGTGGAEEEPQG